MKALSLVRLLRAEKSRLAVQAAGLKADVALLGGGGTWPRAEGGSRFRTPTLDSTESAIEAAMEASSPTTQPLTLTPPHPHALH